MAQLNWMRWTGWLVLAAIFLFLIGPFLLIAAAGLSAGDTLAFPPQGLSLRWVEAVMGMDNFRRIESEVRKKNPGMTAHDIGFLLHEEFGKNFLVQRFVSGESVG